jgi:hypothetical protein
MRNVVHQKTFAEMSAQIDRDLATIDRNLRLATIFVSLTAFFLLIALVIVIVKHV